MSRIMTAVLALALETAATTNDLRRVEFREPHASAYVLVQSSSTNAGVSAKSATAPRAAWTQAVIEGTTYPVELGSRVVLQLKSDGHLEALLAGRDLVVSRVVGPQLFILQAPDSQSAIDSAEQLVGQNRVLACYPIMRRPLKRHRSYALAPNDPLFARQWHLENRGADYNLAGPDLNVRTAWSETRGNGVVVAVADDGFQLDHPDLIARAVDQPHYNFYRDVSSGGPGSSDADHATAVAGLIAAEAGNQLGVAGVAPQARLASWVIFGTSSFGQDNIATDEQLMDMFQYASNRVAVQNHSWGSAVATQLPLDTLADAGVENAVNKGRDGLGVVIVRASGNGREDLFDVNDDGYASDPRVIAVAALRKDGRACSYSSPGACLLLAAPSGDLLDSDEDGVLDTSDPEAPDVWTTDRVGVAGYNTDAGDAGNYVGFNGTSASSPQVAGTAALILSANSHLSYRDVQQILLLSARHYDLADPDVTLNGAGLRISHNVGFGVPDAGVAADLAKTWSNRPPATSVSVTNTTRLAIPDDALRLICSAAGISSALQSIRCLPSLGPHPDDPTATCPIVYVGQANDELTEDLSGKATLIQRGGSYFSDKIARAARVGAVFAILFNNTGSTEIQAMGGTTFVPIPAISIGKKDGEALRDFIALHPDTTARLQLASAAYRFNLTNTLVCEHVGVRLKTTHSRRSDVRVTLVSPMGTRSVLQAINGDSTPGPSDWTYWSTHHFFESSAGEWRLAVSDERNTKVRTSPSTSVAATGTVTYAELIVHGVGITDRDRDGLDDAWEMRWFGSLDYGPQDDPDQEGCSNTREKVLGCDPTSPDAAFQLELMQLAPGFWRFSWPGRDGRRYVLQQSSDLRTPFADVAVVSGRFPVTEYVVPVPNKQGGFYRVRNFGNP